MRCWDVCCKMVSLLVLILRNMGVFRYFWLPNLKKRTGAQAPFFPRLYAYCLQDRDFYTYIISGDRSEGNFLLFGSYLRNPTYDFLQTFTFRMGDNCTFYWYIVCLDSTAFYIFFSPLKKRFETRFSKESPSRAYISGFNFTILFKLFIS